LADTVVGLAHGLASSGMDAVPLALYG
jgi:hypothetical protein